jgi:hypothetical protein
MGSFYEIFATDQASTTAPPILSDAFAGRAEVRPTQLATAGLGGVGFSPPKPAQNEQRLPPVLRYSHVLPQATALDQRSAIVVPFLELAHFK